MSLSQKNNYYLHDARVKRLCVSCLHEKPWLWDPPNMRKQPFFEEKCADFECFRILGAQTAKKSEGITGSKTFAPTS